MSEQGFISQLPIGPFASRPRLVGAICAGGLSAILFGFVPNALSPSTRTILSWDAACLWFIGACILGMIGRRDHDIRLRAAKQDDGRGFILALVTLAAVASLGAIALELSLAKGEHSAMKGLRVGLGFATVAASWFVVQLIFAMHYAHEYYSAPDNDPSGLRRGLAFPGDDSPDYWDFVHFAVVIGVASQTADIAFTSKTLRRIGTVHGVIAFSFNTVVLALTINLIAGLF